MIWTRPFVLFCATVLGAAGSLACSAQVYGRASSPPPPSLAIHADMGAGTDVTAVAYAGPNPDVEDTSVFYAALTPYGMWTTIEPYGQVWVPRVPPGWLPYSEGHWVYTDVGWTWVSSEPWGWAVFHYGRWYRDPLYHWVWVPGTHWAPAWVAWRYGGHEVGWAPLPPRARWQAGIGLNLGPGGQLDAYIAPDDWHFVHERFLGSADLHRHYQSRGRNFAFIRATRNVTDYRVVHRRIVDRGVSVRDVERARGAPVPRMKIVSRHLPGRSEIRGDHEVTLYFPQGRHRAAEREHVRPSRGFVTPSPRPGYEEPREQRRTHRAQPERQSFAEHRQALERDRLRQMQAERAARAERSARRTHGGRAYGDAPSAARQRQPVERRAQASLQPQRAERRAGERRERERRAVAPREGARAPNTERRAGERRGERTRAPSAERRSRAVQTPGPAPERSARRETRREHRRR